MTLSNILAHLECLISCDTQNPPRNIEADHSVFRYIDSVLQRTGEFRISVEDYGHGRVCYLAQRGDPQILFNVHLDTVATGDGWTRRPLDLTVEDARAYGRGACDTKGAAAALLSIAESSDEPMAILFSTDEEGADGCCISRFSQALPAERYRAVVVAEPTECSAVTAHRGYLSVLGEFHGVAGHSSSPRALMENANHQAALWASAALSYASNEAESGRNLCFNIGTILGESSSNVIATNSRVHWSARLPPGGDSDSVLTTICNITEAAKKVRWNARFKGLPLPTNNGIEVASREFCAKHNLDVAAPVDYWTEASIFSAAGIPAIVLGPGCIDQAHTADEWVGLDQLTTAAGIYHRLIREAHE